MACILDDYRLMIVINSFIENMLVTIINIGGVNLVRLRKHGARRLLLINICMTGNLCR